MSGCASTGARFGATALAIVATLLLAAPAPAKPEAGSKQRHCKKTQVLRHGKCVPKPTPAPMSDADGDGLPYAWEVSGSKAAGGEPAPAPGANPEHKDIFLQLDYANEQIRSQRTCGELDELVAAFARAPVANPDGKPGIDLHIDAGIACQGGRYELGGSIVFHAGACPGWQGTFQSLKLAESRFHTFHVAGLSPRCSAEARDGYGLGSENGTEIAILTEGTGIGIVLMHELGHNLSLEHGAAGAPNRFSVMSGPIVTSSDGSGRDSAQILDYQRFELPALDEQRLSEAAGLSGPPQLHRYFVFHFCPEGSSTGSSPAGFRSDWPGDGPVDWNCSGPFIPLPGEAPSIDPGTVAADVNGDGKLTVLPATHDEWLELDYGSGGQIGPGGRGVRRPGARLRRTPRRSASPLGGD